MREVQGTGGALFVQQLKAAGVEHIFFNPSTGDYPIFDALVDEPGIQLIKGIHEGAVVAMADGYARASGKTGVVIVANIGLPNAMTQMVNSWKDQIPVLVAVASVEQDALGRDLFQEPDHCEVMTQPITKWYWAAKTTGSIPETVRRGMKFASTSPCGPVFLSLPTNTLREEANATIWDQAKFDVPMRIRPDKDDIEKAARMLLEAKNPLMSVGDEASLVPRRQGAGRARRAARPSRRRAGRRARLLVEAVPDPASALYRHAAARHALSRQARRAAQPRQQVRRARRARHAADLDPPRSRRALRAARRSISAWSPTSGSPPPI